MSKETVFVSGATGFIALHTVKVLIEEGYKVVGSVRSTEKGENINKLLKSDNFVYEIVPDIGQPGAFDEALQKHPEVTTFLHTASPFHFKITDPIKDLVEPAVEGTKNALKAIHKYGANVKRVVITSSYAAIMNLEKAGSPEFVSTEESWNPITLEDASKDPMRGYLGSKTFAEKAAWDFVKTEKPKFSLSVVNPVYVFGPQAFDEEVKSELNTSSEVINAITKLKENDAIPSSSGNFIDVRDVAKAHLKAFSSEETKGQRLLTSERFFTAQDILDIYHKNFPKEAAKSPKGVPGSGEKAMSAASKIDNSKTRKLLGFEFISLEKSVVDSIGQILNVQKSK
ncbi:Piso0_000015 [Millerozyma farinosa CBS 7064]|uniref:Piso0_000015 protein n=1 Tax=Pichia sorbitophila (strain ATCC MYA-4447 / BCRC 22081 / CBS 7064 / NBRC 10061 / NRRL Y-12695) TaxID=559304 RepID=G8YSV5_PICSO|nr:Piso0_000015 [Millerozyma farinosa CBS 7064]